MPDRQAGAPVAPLEAALAACDMPREALLNWIAHNEKFCREHGSDVYREWLELYAECRKVLDAS